MRIDRIKLAVTAAQREMKFSEIAEKSGLSRNTVYLIKRGMSCSTAAAQKIADALGVELETILEKR